MMVYVAIDRDNPNIEYVGKTMAEALWAATDPERNDQFIVIDGPLEREVPDPE